MLTLAVLMSRELKTISHEATVHKAAGIMKDQRIGSLLVTRNGNYAGIVSETDLVRRVMAEGMDPGETRIERVMSSPIIGIDIEKTAEEANTIMSENAIRHLAVTDQEKIVGLLSVRDLLIYFKNQF